MKQRHAPLRQRISPRFAAEFSSAFFFFGFAFSLRVITELQADTGIYFMDYISYHNIYMHIVIIFHAISREWPK